MAIGPNFLIIGANKGGTTSLYNYLGQHPEVFVPKIKEPMFFNYYQKQGEDGAFKNQKVIKTFKSYYDLFTGSESFKARGESSTSYLANPNCAENIYDFNPSMKLIVLLRNPIERAFSNYLMYVRWNDEDRTFAKSIQDEINGVELPQGKKYIYLGFYLKSLNTFRERFGDDQVKILLNEDLKNKPKETYRDICEYLNINKDFEPDFSKKFNTNDFVETRRTYRLIKKLDKKLHFSKYLPKELKNKINSKPGIPKNERRILQETYRDEIRELSHFIGRNLSHWLTPNEK